MSRSLSRPIRSLSRFVSPRCNSPELQHFRRPSSRPYKQPQPEEQTRNFFAHIVRRQVNASDVSDAPSELPHSSHQTISSQDRSHAVKKLPRVCSGCGAPSQLVDPEAPGYFDFSKSRNAVFVDSGARRKDTRTVRREEDDIYNQALQRLEGSLTGAQSPKEEQQAVAPSRVPICDRCHALRYQSQGASIIHPSLDSIQAMIEESPHKHNHIYHVVDAADFPMSLVAHLTSALHLPRLRTQNRRSKTIRFVRGRTAEVTFVITRSDLLAPKKEQVDALVPYLKEVLRDAMGKNRKNVRLGNVRCVSAKRGWWTRTVKEEIWRRGGAAWMVGKVNVGKSALYEVVFPKGREHEGDTNPDRLRQQAERDSLAAEGGDALSALSFQEMSIEGKTGKEDGPEEDVLYDENVDSLLPPLQKETAYPEMPTVSDLPGTTASPIRIPYGNGKGELIDLPGIARTTLDAHIKPEFHSQMVMKKRVVPESFSIKPGQSLLLGGVIRITPKLHHGEELIFMAYPFMSEAFTPHITSTTKAIAIQTGQYDVQGSEKPGEEYTGTVGSIATPEAKTKVRSAGAFPLAWDATKKRTGSLTAKHAGGLKSERLPFVVYSADILVEGVGWVELACQVRKRRTEDALSHLDQIAAVPEVELFTPEGKYVGVRRPMNAFLLGGPKKVPVHKRRVRPRQSIGMKKRQESSRRAKKMASAAASS